MNHAHRAMRAAALALSLAAVAGPVQAAEWLPAQGVAASQRSAAAAAAEARRTALGRALAGFLQEWLSLDDIRHHGRLLDRQFFSRPDRYVAATSDVTTRAAGSRQVWQGKVQFDALAVAEGLRQIGLLSPWDRDPVLVLQRGPGLASNAAHTLTTAAWARELSELGVQLVWADDPRRPETADGTLTVSSDARHVAHPLLPEQGWAVTTMVLEGDVRGTPLRAAIVAEPSALAPPADLTVTALADRILQAWSGPFLAELREARWQAGDFRFATVRDWAAFDARLFQERATFHQVHALELRRDGSGVVARYGFFLNPGEEASAQAWLINQDFDVTQAEGQRFVIGAP